MTAPSIIYGTRVRVFVQASGTGASTNADEYSAIVKEVSMSGGEREVEEIKTLNNNEILKELPQTPMEVELSLIHTDPRAWETVAGGSNAVTRWDSGSYPIIVSGDTTRVKQRVWVEASGTSSDDWKERLLWNDAFGVASDLSISADGYMEETVRFRCTADDYTREWTGSYTSAPVSTLPSY